MGPPARRRRFLLVWKRLRESNPVGKVMDSSPPSRIGLAISHHWRGRIVSTMPGAILAYRLEAFRACICGFVRLVLAVGHTTGTASHHTPSLLAIRTST